MGYGQRRFRRAPKIIPNHFIVFQLTNVPFFRYRWFRWFATRIRFRT